MKIKILRLFIFSVLSLTIGSIKAPAANPPPTAGETLQALREQRKAEVMQEKAERPKAKAEVEGEKEIQPVIPAEGAMEVGPKAMIETIEVSGVTILKPEKVREIVSSYEGKELSLSDFKVVADAITDEYRSRGYATSFAYVPPQRIDKGILELAVIEGKVGEVSVSGNRWFRKKQILRYVDVKEGQDFNYDILQECMRRMNANPDRHGRMVLSGGEAPGTTNVDVQMKDRFPWHVSLTYNNFNSDYLENNKYAIGIQSNNFLGFGDIWAGEVQLGEAGLYQLYSTRYLLPLTQKLSWGIYYINIHQRLGGAVKGQNQSGRGNVINTYFSYRLIDKQNFTMSFNPAFEWKDIKNFVAGTENGYDKTRLIKAGFDFDITDPWRGRTIATQEFNTGIPNIMGGLHRHDSEGSRQDTGGLFFAAVTNITRMQPMPKQMVNLVKFAMQMTANRLPGSEQFQVGGPYTVRGYPVSELAGDIGLTASVEQYFPFYPVPRSWKIPYTKTPLREALNAVVFYDFGLAKNISPKEGEISSAGLNSAGVGFRFNVSQRVSFLFDYAVPIGKRPSDGRDGGRIYLEAKIMY